MATTAHTEVPHEGKGQFPPFNPSTFASQLVWLAIAFVVLRLAYGLAYLANIAWLRSLSDDPKPLP